MFLDVIVGGEGLVGVLSFVSVDEFKNHEDKEQNQSHACKPNVPGAVSRFCLSVTILHLPLVKRSFEMDSKLQVEVFNWVAVQVQGWCEETTWLLK